MEYLPLLSLKHITVLYAARKGELIQHVNKKKGKSERQEEEGKEQREGGTEGEILLKNEVTESFLCAGRVARQFSNV